MTEDSGECEACALDIGETSINHEAVAALINEMRTNPAYKFDINYMCFVDSGDIRGDASLFALAVKHRGEDIVAKYAELNQELGVRVSEVILADFTGIPIEDTKNLMWPDALFSDYEYDLDTVTAEDFIRILEAYLETGKILWDVYYHERTAKDDD